MIESVQFLMNMQILLLPAKVIPFVFLSSLLSFFSLADQEYLSFQLRVQEIFSKYKTSIVRVKATGEHTVEGKKTRLLKMGSGFFISKDGHVLTTGLSTKRRTGMDRA